MKKFTPTESFTVLSGFAQQINAPLKSLLLSSQKLLDTYKGKNFEYISYKDFKHMVVTLEQMNKQINRCYQTTKQLMSLKESNAKQDSCDINEAIHDILDLLQQQIVFHKIRQTINLKKEIPLVLLSRVDAHQVLHNILTNSIQAMPAGGRVKIRTLFDQKSNYVLLEILDEGVGITPLHLSKVFEPFFTTKEQGVERSAGLGLSIVYSIIQSVGGLIDIQSSLRKGTQVKIFLPANKND